MMIAYLKISDFCNLGCSHCYIPRHMRENKTVMTVTVLHQAITDLMMLCKNKKSSHLNIVWHGGEPLLVGTSILIDYMDRVKSAFKDTGITVSFSIQTSLIPLNKKWVNVIKEYFDGEVGISVDFSSRKMAGSVEHYFEVLKKRLAMCVDADIRVAANVVVSKDELGCASELVEWFVDNDILEVEFSRYNSYGGEPKSKPTNREHSIFLSDVIDVIIRRAKEGSPCPVIPIIDAAAMVAISGRSSATWGGGCLNTNYVINPDGKTNNCPDRISYDPSFSGNGIAFMESMGRAKTNVEYNRRISSLSCSECEYRSSCKGGCPIESIDILANGDCAGFKTLLDYIQKLYKEDAFAKSCIDLVLKNA